MPNVSFVVTNSLQSAWGGYWKRRPNDEPLDLIETLCSSEVVTDVEGTGLNPKPGSQLWSHPQMPGVVFAAKGQSGIEYVVVGILRCRGDKGQAVEGGEAVIDPRTTEMPPAAPITDGLTASELHAVLTQRRNDLMRWLGKTVKRNVNRGLANAEIAAVSAQLKEVGRVVGKERAEADRVRAAAARQVRIADEPEEADDFVTTPDGKFLLVPTTRWLLRQVKELQAKVTELETLTRRG